MTNNKASGQCRAFQAARFPESKHHSHVLSTRDGLAFQEAQHRSKHFNLRRFAGCRQAAAGKGSLN
jgi:hypothetical protein